MAYLYSHCAPSPWSLSIAPSSRFPPPNFAHPHQVRRLDGHHPPLSTGPQEPVPVAPLGSSCQARLSAGEKRPRTAAVLGSWAALRARLIAALAGGFVPVWRWLQQSGIGWFVSYVFSRLRVRIDPSAESHYNPANPVQIVDPSPASDPSAASQKKKPEQPKHVVQAVWYTPLKKPEQPLPSAAPDSTLKPKLKLHVVDDIEVPLDQEKRFQEYCERAMNVRGRSSLCHHCVFEWNCVPNGTVPNSGINTHCNEFHDGIGMPCLNRECKVQFKEGNHRERRLHQYFFHELPRRWWLKRQGFP